MIRLSIFSSRQHQQLELAAARFQIGTGIHRRDSEANDRLPLVWIDDPLLSEVQAVFELQDDGSLMLGNLGAAVVLPSGRRVYRGNRARLELPVRINLGETTLELAVAPQPQPSIDQALVSFEQAADQLLAELENAPAENPTQTTVDQQRGPSSAKLGLWFEAISNLQRTAAGSRDFFIQAARCMSDPGGLDSAMVLARGRNGWEIAASFVPCPELGISFRADIVQRVAESQTTVFHDADLLRDSECADFVVCSPILGGDGNASSGGGAVSHVLYGVRSRNRSNHRVGIRRIEAQFVKMIAESVTASLGRMQLESQAVRDQVLLQQAFSPEVTRLLQRDPAVLKGRDREVTVLFADIRGFTRLAERNSPELVFEFLGDVMDTLTRVIEQHGGVVLDYMGDGLAAFWNAPLQQEDHPRLACDAAVAALDEIPGINQRWNSLLGRNVCMGFGLHTGRAQVGNSGSSRRLKYGPRGNTVNLAQRIESATKHIGLPLLVSGETARRLGDGYVARRILTTCLPGIEKPLAIFQPLQRGRYSPEQMQACRDYESALEAFEKGDLSTALHKLVELDPLLGGDAAVEMLAREIRLGVRTEPGQAAGTSADGAVPETAARVYRPLQSPVCRDT